ncbi:transferrin-binding protein-like solute binding protein [Ferribacterium limneticum]|uniref:transferrin-binding protein-like solute binding protein n=1 Tax=Ferribacterium limneticum TaxID=76259 RepID=UPI001CF921A3|nr:transferrin-binding protein-like solute binding protein [Ferribacterium limneticum]UCV24443.1 transferrin-binding protein-like solute binding protein [Ferribacterium limneticum]
MKKNCSIVATSIVALFATSPVFAIDSWQFHENDWSKVRSYATVPISQDSLDSWGAWGGFVEPAAGAPSVAQMPGVAGSDPYRTTPNATRVAADVCRGGDWCGYAVFANQQWDYNQSRGKGESSEGNTYSGPMAGLFGLTLTPDNPTAVTVNGGSGSGMVSWRLAGLTGTAPLLNNSGTDLPATFGNWYWYSGGQGGLNNFYAERYSNTDNGNTTTYGGSYVYGFPQDYYYYWGLPTSNKEVAVGWFGRYIESYVNGQDEEREWNNGNGTQTYGYYVAGIATPQAYLDSQRAGNVVATYSGSSMDVRGYQTSVNMTVNFGNATWSGSWNNGSDGHVYTNTASNGATHLHGQVGFNASGTISGANINSTALSANDGIVTGKVQGTFYGQTAGSIGGVSDIVKTNTATMTPTTAAHTAVFLVNKVENTPR